MLGIKNYNRGRISTVCPVPKPASQVLLCSSSSAELRGIIVPMKLKLIEGKPIFVILINPEVNLIADPNNLKVLDLE